MSQGGAQTGITTLRSATARPRTATARPGAAPLPTKLNYLHYGDALDRLKRLRDLPARARVNKARLLSDLSRSTRPCRHLAYLVTRYGSTHRRRVNLARLRRDLEATLLARSAFARLRCRGFSYRYSSRPTGFPAQLRSAIDVRAAIFADTRSHYPPRVLAYLTRMSSSHYYDYHGPAIAFAFGMLRNRRLYIVTLQSDLVYSTPSAVRDHFRGWRRVLLSLLASQIRPREILLIRSDDVLRACYNAANVPRKVPLSWRNIYEQTAREAGGRQVELARGLNVQLYAHHPKVIARSFYVL